jgi:carboxymethylproline synthase
MEGSEALPALADEGLHATFEDGLLRIALAHRKRTNPFSRRMTLALRDLAVRAAAAPDLRGVLLWGGPDRSFSAGGDFEDVSRLTERVAIRDYLLEIIDLYVALLAIEAPVVVAIDHVAIGQGLQVALTADWRIGTPRTRVSMPELKNGVACPLGVTLLDAYFGRGFMQRAVIGCDELDAQAALQAGILSESVDAEALQGQAEARLVQLAAYPATPFRATKRFTNAPLIQRLHAAREEAAAAHVASFLAKAGQSHFEKILGRA